MISWCVLRMITAVASLILSFTTGMLRSSQSERAAAGQRFDFAVMGSAMMSRSAASISGPWAYWSATWPMSRACLMLCWSSYWVRPWRSALRRSQLRSHDSRC